MDCIINWTRLQRILNGNCKCTNLFSSWRWWNKSKIYGLTVGCKTAINTRCNNFMFIIDFWCMNAALKLKKNIWMLAYLLMNRWSQKSFTLSKKFDTHTQIPVVNIFANQRIKLHTKIYMKVVQISNIKVHITTCQMMKKLLQHSWHDTSDGNCAFCQTRCCISGSA